VLLYKYYWRMCKLSPPGGGIHFVLMILLVSLRVSGSSAWSPAIHSFLVLRPEKICFKSIFCRTVRFKYICFWIICFKSFVFLGSQNNLLTKRLFQKHLLKTMCFKSSALNHLFKQCSSKYCRGGLVGMILIHHNCSLPRWRVQGIKRIYLVSRTHGLFIT
jgi:hypothetical protein